MNVFLALCFIGLVAATPVERTTKTKTITKGGIVTSGNVKGRVTGGSQAFQTTGSEINHVNSLTDLISQRDGSAFGFSASLGKTRHVGDSNKELAGINTDTATKVITTGEAKARSDANAGASVNTDRSKLHGLSGSRAASELFGAASNRGSANASTASQETNTGSLSQTGVSSGSSSTARGNAIAKQLNSVVAQTTRNGTDSVSKGNVITKVASDGSAIAEQVASGSATRFDSGFKKRTGSVTTASGGAAATGVGASADGASGSGSRADDNAGGGSGSQSAQRTRADQNGEAITHVVGSGTSASLFNPKEAEVTRETSASFKIGQQSSGKAATDTAVNAQGEAGGISGVVGSDAAGGGSTVDEGSLKAKLKTLAASNLDLNFDH